MNTNELQKIDRIITKDLAHFIEKKYSVTQPLAADFEDAIRKEINRIKNSFSFGALRYPKRSAMRHFIQHHQLILIRLLGKLVQYNSPKKILKPGSKVLDNTVLCHSLYDSLEELLVFVEKHFPTHLNNETWIPNEYRLLAAYDIGKNIRSIQIDLENMGVKRELVNLAFQPIKKFMENPYSTKLTYSRLIYLRKIKAEFSAFITTSDHDDVSISFQYLLIALNFNTFNYYTYCIKQIRIYEEEGGSLPERVERIALVHKLLNQAIVKNGYAYNQDITTLKSQLIMWVTQELNFLKSKEALPTTPPDRKLPVSSKSRFVRTILSVPQLAFLLRVFYEMNILSSSKSLDFLFELVTSAFQTKEAAAPSPRSFHNTYYGPDDHSIQVVRNLLLKMIEHIDRFIEKRKA